MAASRKNSAAGTRIARLDKMSGILTELGRVYREARRGEMDVQDGTRLASILATMRLVVEGSEIERRVQDLEARMEAKR